MICEGIRLDKVPQPVLSDLNYVRDARQSSRSQVREERLRRGQSGVISAGRTWRRLLMSAWASVAGPMEIVMGL
ncbi:hypothetical protein AOLI_G00092840 [Acnodon oligacanthus]